MPLEGKNESLARFKAKCGEEWTKTCIAFENVCMGPVLMNAMERTPVDTGTLRASAQVCSFTEAYPDECICHLGYGGSAQAYALRQHQCVEFHHTTGEALFLEKACLEYAPRIPELVLARKGALQ